MREIEWRAAEAFRSQFGVNCERLTSAPGRINLIGEHTDYNGGFVLPCAIDYRVSCAIGAGEGTLYSSDFDEMRSVEGVRNGSWADYPSGVVWALSEGESLGQFRAAFAGNVPVGAGLSSSAAIESAMALALQAFFHLEISRTDLALACQRAENAFVGVSSGIMDQYASLLCEEGAALLIDCRSLKSQQIRLDLRGNGLTLLVCNTRVHRSLQETEYNERRASCEAAARALDVSQLRDATLSDLDRLQGVALKRTRHVVSENQRVIEAVEALERSDFEAFGALMLASHRSLRDDYEVSTPELDAFVEVAMTNGALGARLTGAGFGGCAISLTEENGADAVEEATLTVFAMRGFSKPEFYRFGPSDGAEVVL